MSRRTVTEAFGTDVANALAAMAIDLLCDPPARIASGTTRVSTKMVWEGRRILEAAGIDWRALVAARIQQEKEARERVHGSPT